MGGSETEPGIFINWSLKLGTTSSRCITFNKFWPISRDLIFDIRILELWVVNEVFMKKRITPKRDFYNTVVMWNRIGKNKAKEEDRRTDLRERYFQNEINTPPDHCSHGEIYETNERHFEPSNPYLTATNNIDDELLTAIKKRLAGVPPFPGSLSPKHGTELQTSNKPFYLSNRDQCKPKRVPTPVSTQVDDSMITELKNQSTSTSHVKVISRFTQSGMGLSSHMDDTGQSTRLTSRIQLEGGNAHSLPQERNSGPHNYSFKSHHSYEQRTLKPRQNSFPNHTKPSMQSPATTSTFVNYDDPEPNEAFRNIMQTNRDSQSQSDVPNYYQVTSQQPSTLGKFRSSIGSSYNQPIHELSWSKRNMGAILPYQQQLVHAAPPYHGDQYEDPNIRRSPSRKNNNPRDGPTEVNRDHSPISVGGRSQVDPHQNRPSLTRSIREYERIEGNIEDISLAPITMPSSYQDRVSPNSMRDGEQLKAPSPHRVRLDSTGWAAQPPPQLPSPLGEQTALLAMTTEQVQSSQFCKCGSQELTMVCRCKKSTSILKEREIISRDCERGCQCPRKYDSIDKSKNKEKKKEKKIKADKEAKAEEKRRKKEEKEREKRAKKEQKAREKERKKSKSKQGTKKKHKGDRKKECKMCSCCKCGGDDEDPALQADANLSEISQKSKKKPKREKTPKGEKKKKKTKKGTLSSVRSCECPPTQELTLHEHPTQHKNRELSTLGFCNHPENPCPALRSKEIGQESVSSKSVVIPTRIGIPCGDPVCPRTKRDQRGDTKVVRSCSCDAPKPFRNCCCGKLSTGRDANVCNYVTNTALTEQTSVVYDNSSIHRNSQSYQHDQSPLPVRTSLPTDAPKYRDITAAPVRIFPNEVGHGDTPDMFLYPSRSQNPRITSSSSGLPKNDDLLMDSSKIRRDSNDNKRYIPPCVLYLDCTKVKDLCVIIKDKYDDTS